MSDVSDPVARHILAILRQMKCNFVLNEQPIELELIAATDGLLPGIVRKADQLALFCLGYDLGGTISSDANAKLGVRVVFNESVAHTVRILCLIDTIMEAVQYAKNKNAVPADNWQI